MATTYLTRTFAAGNQKTWTISVWVKRSGSFASQQNILAVSSGASAFHICYFAGGTGEITINYNSSKILGTARKFRDVGTWYHLVFAQDSTQSTEADRTKLWVNGEQVTLTGTFPTLNEDMTINSATRHDISNQGAYYNNNSYFDGLMSHYHFADGTAYAPTVFGETDATTGEWKIIVDPTFTLGTNGFTILKDGNTITDQSSNSNDFTLGGGTLTNTEDNPSNVFATFNPLDVNDGTVTTFSNGNTTTMHNAGGNGATDAARSTLGYSKGKFYWETKCIAVGGDVRTGIISMSSSDYNTEANPYTLNETYTYKQNGDKGSISGETSYGATYTAGDIIGIAHDVSAGTLTFYKNGVSQGTAFSGLSTSLTWGAFSTEYNQGKYSYNFGNGYFGTTIISSEGTNASNIGKFEYDVPTGFTALCTKGLNE